MTNQEKVLEKRPKAVCIESKSGYMFRRTDYTIIDSDSGIALGPTSLDSEAEAWQYAAQRMNLIK